MKKKFEYRIKEEIMINNISYFYPEMKTKINSLHTLDLFSDFEPMLDDNKHCGSYNEALDIINTHKNSTPLEVKYHTIDDMVDDNNRRKFVTEVAEAVGDAIDKGILIEPNDIINVVLTDFIKENINMDVDRIIESVEHLNNHILYGEYRSDNSKPDFDFSLKLVSHQIYNIRYDIDNKIIIGDVRFMTFKNGQTAYELYSSGNAEFKMRFVKSKIFTWDIIKIDR